MERPWQSVIVPCGNGERWLAAALELGIEYFPHARSSRRVLGGAPRMTDQRPVWAPQCDVEALAIFNMGFKRGKLIDGWK